MLRLAALSYQMSCAAPNKINIVSTSCRIICCCFAVGAPWPRKAFGPIPTPKIACLVGALGLRTFCGKFLAAMTAEL